MNDKNTKISYLSNIIKDIEYIVLYNNIDDYHFLHFKPITENIDDENEDVEDSKEMNILYGSDISDIFIKSLTSERIKGMTNAEVLDRVNRLNPDILTAEQKLLLQDFYKQKIIVDKAGIQKLLDLIKECNYVIFEPYHKTNIFMKKYNLDDNDILNILKDLKLSDYYRSTKSINLNNLGNNIIIFEPTVELGKDKKQIIIYIKLDVDKSTGDTIIVVSIHDIKNQNNLLYKNNNERNDDEMNKQKILSEAQTADINKKIEAIDELIDDIYEMRRKSINKDGEYGIGNLVFKEFRNLGYLQQLKDKKIELENQRLSLESLDLNESNKLKDNKIYKKYKKKQDKYPDQYIPSSGLNTTSIIPDKQAGIADFNNMSTPINVSMSLGENKNK